MTKGLSSIYKKELSGYFRSSFAYFTLSIYGIFSLIMAFYSAGYFQLNNADMFSLFYFQPQVMSFIIPAITMRLWAEEKKTGTIEFLLTQPITIPTIVVAKYLAAFSFGLIMLSLTLPLTIYTAFLTQLDTINIISSYLGGILAVSAFCAVGCAISAMNKNPITAYILSLSICWFIASLTYLPALSFQINYLEFVQGQPGINNILYFIYLTVLALLINSAILKYKHNLLIYFSVLGASFVLLSISSYMLLNTYKLDLTTDKINSLSQNTKDIIDDLEQDISIRVFLSEDLSKENPLFNQYTQYILGFLEKYQSYSNDQISVQLRYIEPFSATEQEVLNLKLVPIQDNNNQINLFFGAVIEDEEQNTYPVSLTDPSHQSFFEQEISRVLYIINSQRAERVGMISPKNFSINEFRTRIERTYSLIDISPNEFQIPLDINSLILINPQNISDGLLYAIDQYVLRGGNLLLFIDEKSPRISSITQPLQTSFVDYLEQLGIEYNSEIINPAEVELSPLNFPTNIIMRAFGSFTAPSAQPLIMYQNHKLGVEYVGKFRSYFAKNILYGTSYENKMLPFVLDSVEDSRIIAIADASMLTDINNMDYLEYLIDEINDNQLLIRKNTIPTNTSIGASIQNQISIKYQETLDNLKAKLLEEKNSLEENHLAASFSIANIKDIELQKQIIFELNQELKRLSYQMKSEQNKSVYKIMIINLALPIIISLIMLILTFAIRRRADQKALEMINE